MFKKTFLAFAAIAAFGIGSVDTASAINLGLMRKPGVERATTYAPIGYTIFCMNNRSECRGGGSSVVQYNAATMAKLNQVNRSVNASIRPVADTSEKWSVNVSSGDCEDYALTKRSRLIRAGLPAGALRLADVTTARGERHAVLVVKTTSGDYVLDNLRGSIVKRQSTGYRFNSVATANPMKWSRF